jgi:hypothetical protein
MLEQENLRYLEVAVATEAEAAILTTAAALWAAEA